MSPLWCTSTLRASLFIRFVSRLVALSVFINSMTARLCGQSGALGGVSEHLEFVSVAHGEGDGLFVDVAILAVAQSE